MKKLLLILSIFVVTFSASAADLNPFAYNLKSEYNPNTLTLTVNFSLNAPASYMKLAISDGTTDVWTKEYLASSYQSGKVPKATYTEVIDVSELPKRTDLTWRVDVKGFGRADVEKVDKEYYFYHPSSIDVDNNTESENFGTIFCVESLNTIKSKSAATTGDSGHPFSEYLTYTNGAGLYVFNAAFENQLTKNGDKGYNGGINFDNLTYSRNGAAAFCPRRVRVSSDGRIFLSSQILDGTSSAVLWEVPGIGDKAAGWHRVIQGSLTDYSSTTEKDGFYAAPNISLDTRGQGADLELALISGTSSAWSSTASAYRLSTYKLGENADNPILNKSQIDWFDNLAGTTIVAWDAVQIEGDNDGGFWICQGRGVAPEGRQQDPSLIHFNKNKQPDLVERRLYRYGGGIRFNNDFSKLIVSGKSDVTTISGVETKSATTNCTGGYATIYDVTKNGTGAPILTESKIIDMRHIADNLYINDFAWDYADNIYAVSHRNEMVAVWAMPYDAGRVKSTPAASKYTFSVDCQPGVYHTVTMVSDPDDGGSITCMQGGAARTPGVLTVESCTELTLTAIPAAGHKFVNWTDDEDNVVSTTPEYTFYVTDEIKLIANFEYATYSGIVWKNLFIGGEANDIAAESADFPKTNERLWRLMQVEFNKYRTNQSQSVMADCDDLVDSNVTKLARGKKTMLNVYGFFDPVGVSDKSPAKNFFKTNECFAWLKTYLEEHSLNNLKGSSSTLAWMYYPFMFINRTDTALNWYNQEIGDICNYVINGDNCSKTEYGNVTIRWDSFITYGQPKHWRPYWAEHACGLKATMTYDEYMPTVTTWKRPASIATADDYITKIGTSTNVYPVRDWYKWNVPANDESIKDVAYQKYFILAWRKGSPTANEIVHHVYESNMELHASYVLKNIDEEDRVDVSKYDASNDDVFKLMLNRRWVNLDPDPTRVPTHSLTITRKLQAGMYNTICLPFDVNLTGLADNNDYKHPLKDADAYEFAGTTTSTYNESGEPVTVLNFNKVTQLRAGTPYLIQLKGDADVTDVLPFTSVACDTILRPSVGGGLIFQPTINPTTVPAGSLILVANNRLAQTTEDGKMNGMRGYFMIDPNNPLLADDIAEQAKDGRVYLSFQKPVTTSVPLAPEAEQPKQPKVRKVMYNGQIYILRGEEVYTITGHRVK